MLEFNRNKVHKIALVIGVGDGACKALNHIYLNNNFDTFDFLAVNTDKQALSNLEIPSTKQLLIGVKTTKGMGCGTDPKLGKKSAIESITAIKEHISKEYKIIFILAAMGGGTGTGASQFIAELCQKSGSLVISVVSGPHKLEAEIRQIHAHNGINSLCKCSDAVFLFPNDRIISLLDFESNPLAFKASDQIFKMPVEIILDLISNQGYINIDLEDMESTLRGVNALTAIISGTGHGHERLAEVLREMYASPYLSEIKINSTEKILVSFEYGSESEITMNEMGDAIDSLQDKFGFDTKISWGNCFNPRLSNQIRISAIVS
ncbi:MAG TPA: cell division protein FtsZ [Prolixibacteraceae bacterium]|nr:cell division protein FtsZ [Prolixibacteraceae bacterium]